MATALFTESKVRGGRVVLAIEASLDAEDDFGPARDRAWRNLRQGESGNWMFEFQSIGERIVHAAERIVSGDFEVRHLVARDPDAGRYLGETRKAFLERFGADGADDEDLLRTRMMVAIAEGKINPRADDCRFGYYWIDDLSYDAFKALGSLPPWAHLKQARYGRNEVTLDAGKRTADLMRFLDPSVEIDPDDEQLPVAVTAGQVITAKVARLKIRRRKELGAKKAGSKRRRTARSRAAAPRSRGKRRRG